MVDYEHNSAIEHAIPDPGWLIASHVVESADYAARRSHGSKAWLLFYTIGGEGCVRGQNKEYSCHPNEITIIKPDTPHYYYTKGAAGWDFYWVYFMPRASWMDWLKLPELCPGISAYTISDPETKSRLVRTFEQMIEDCMHMDAIHQELARSNVEEILLLVYRQMLKSTEQQLDPRITDILEFLKQHYGKQHSIEQLAQLACLSPSRLSHLFKSQVGQSIVDTLLQIRLEKAASLLRFTSMSVAETADAVGFQSLNYFAKKFRFFYGLSPSEYRLKDCKLDFRKLKKKRPQFDNDLVRSQSDQ